MRNTRLLGLVIAGIGAVLVVVGIIGWVSSGDEPDDTAAQVAVATNPPPTTVPETTTTTTAPTTTEAPTPVTTTTTVATTTTTTVGASDIATFVQRFAAALENGDVGFVTDRLHPEVIDGYGADLCATWISTEIMTLSNYRLVEGPDGPVEQRFSTPGGDRSIQNAWSGRVAFSFQGEEFEGDAGFAVLNGSVYWLGQCR